MIQKQGQNDFVLPFKKKECQRLEQERMKREQEKRKTINISH
jgi:hypothetical protein